MPVLSFLYQYAIGGAFFLICTYLIVRSGSIDLSTRSGRRSLTILLGGLLFYSGGHAFSVLVLPYL